MDVKSRNGEKFEIFANFLAHPVETPWPILTVLHQKALRKIEMVAVHCTNETIPHFFEFLTPPFPAQGPMDPRGEGACRQTLSLHK